MALPWKWGLELDRAVQSPATRHIVRKRGCGSLFSVCTFTATLVAVLKYRRAVSGYRDGPRVLGDSPVAHDGCYSKIRPAETCFNDPHRRDLVPFHAGEDGRFRGSL